MYSFIPLTDKAFDDDNWQEFRNLLEVLHKRYKSRFNDAPWQQIKSRYSSFHEKEKTYNKTVILDKSGPVGWISFWIMNQRTPGQMTLLEFDALDETIPARLTRMAGQWYYDRMKEYDSSRALFISSDERITAFARGLNGKQLNRIDDYVLHPKEANIEVIKEWLSVIPKKNNDLRLEFHREIPEVYFSEMARLLTETLGDMPEERDSSIPSVADPEELRKTAEWRRKNKNPIYMCLLFNDKDEMIALSNVDINLHNTKEIEQKMTGVSRSYRGRGLSKWLKAEMFMRLCKEFPDIEVITTNMRAVNEPILKVNARMGFKLDRRGFEFQIEKEKLEQYLNSGK